MKNMTPLYELIATSEDWLLKRLAEYTRNRGYAKYTSTLVEAWRASVEGVSKSLLAALTEFNQPPELDPDDDYAKDPVASFGIIEADKHRKRGISLKMFLGLLKYYRQTYDDLIAESDFELENKELYRLFITRCFDRIELGFCSEWCGLSETEKTVEMQAANRIVTTEKNKYLTIFESLHDPVIFLNKDNRIENMNNTAHEVFFGAGLPGETYYSQSLEDKSLPFPNEELVDLMSSGSIEMKFEKQLQTFKGKRVFQIKMKRMLDISEKFSGTVFVLSDITERKEAEAARLESELELLEAQRLANIGSWTYDLVSQQPQWSEQMFHIWGLDSKLGPPYYTEHKKYIHPDDFQRLDSAVREAVEFGKPYQLELRILRPDGSERTIITICEPQCDAAGKVVRMRGTNQDITERKHTEEALRESREQLDLALISSGMATFEWDIVKNERTWSDGVHRLLGTKPESFTGAADEFLQIIHPEDRSTVQAALSMAVETTGEYETEYRAVWPDGSIHHIAARGKVHRDSDGQAVQMTGVCWDITERKEAEEKIHYLATHDALTNLPGLRLAKDRILMALEMAERHKTLAAIMYVDVDGFKDVNDTYGHDTGDILLKELGKRLLSCVRKVDTVARIGGDEFLLVITGLHSPDGAALIAKKILQHMSEPFDHDGKRATVGVSIGIALYPDHGKDEESLIKQADKAMYVIKNSEKNRYTFASVAK